MAHNQGAQLAEHDLAADRRPGGGDHGCARDRNVLQLDVDLGVVGEPQQQAQRLVGDPVLRGVEVEPGRLGVQASGTAGVSVTFNITTPDAESFRRSETQIAAMLARAVGQGRRNS